MVVLSLPECRMKQKTTELLQTDESSLALAQLGFRAKAHVSACLLVSVLE